MGNRSSESKGRHGARNASYVYGVFLRYQSHAVTHDPGQEQTSCTGDAVHRLLYSDEYLVNLIMYGVEGEEWEFVDEEHGYISETEPGSRTDNYVVGGFWGDYNMVYTFVPYGQDVTEIVADMEEVEKQTAIFEERSLAHMSPAAGFIYWPNRSLSTTIRNINAQVMTRYFLTLAVGNGTKGSDGTFTGPGSTYEDFIEALDNARIETIVADKQEQYSAWQAKQ